MISITQTVVIVCVRLKVISLPCVLADRWGIFGKLRAHRHKQDLIGWIRYVWENDTKRLTCPLDKEVQVSSLR